MPACLHIQYTDLVQEHKNHVYNINFGSVAVYSYASKIDVAFIGILIATCSGVTG